MTDLLMSQKWLHLVSKMFGGGEFFIACIKEKPVRSDYLTKTQGHLRK